MSESPVSRDRLRWFDSRTIAALPAGDTGPRRRILIVDDNRDAARSLSMLLQMDGHEVTVAHDGPSALEAARTGHPEVVLLDISLPGLDGLEVARRLRQDPNRHDVLLVALTGHAQDEDLLRSREAGFNAHLLKPVKLETLSKLISSPDSSAREQTPASENET